MIEKEPLSNTGTENRAQNMFIELKPLLITTSHESLSILRSKQYYKLTVPVHSVAFLKIPFSLVPSCLFEVAQYVFEQQGTTIL